jgi:hypothetical protein
MSNISGTGPPSPARTYFDSDFFPALQDFNRDPTDLRKARIVTDDANNMVERLHAHEKAIGTTQLTEGKYREAAVSTCPTFKLIWDLADARKHGRLTRGLPRLLTTDGQAKITGDFSREHSYEFDICRVVVEDDSGKLHEFEDAINEVATFIGDELKRLSI